jgi:hypothetical protein
LATVLYAGFKNRKRRAFRPNHFSSPRTAENQNMNNLTKSLAIVSALAVSLSAGPPLVASPSDEITRAVAVRGLTNPAHAPAKEFMTAFSAVVLRAEPAELPRYVAAAVKLRPDLAPKIVALAVRVSGNSHRDRATSAAERCDVVAGIMKAAVAITPDAVAEIAGAAAGADREMRQCIIEAAVSVVPGAEEEITLAVNAAANLPSMYSMNNHRGLNPSESAAAVVSPEKPPGQ